MITMDDYILDKVKDVEREAGSSPRKEFFEYFVKFKGRKFPIIYFDKKVLEIETSLSPNLRGLVDIYRADKYYAQCLIVVSSSNGFRVSYEYKRYTEKSAHPPNDYITDENSQLKSAES